MTVINTNVSALIAQNAMKINSREQSLAMQQLSTGKRINVAQDDAAGLAISQKMTAQIRGLEQAVRNGNDGISMLQTTEGALIEVTNMLQRMRELSVQATTDSNAPEDRNNINVEFQQLKLEMTRIAANTQWNGINILNGSSALGVDNNGYRLVNFQLGSNANQTVGFDFKNFSFTPQGTDLSATTTLNFNSKAAVTTIQQITATIGTLNVVVNLDSAITSNPSASQVISLAAEMQTKLRTYSGLGEISVTSATDSEIIVITDNKGRAITNLLFKTSSGGTPGVATTSNAYANFATKSTGTDTQRVTATIGGVNVDITLTSALAQDPSPDQIIALASDMQTKLRTLSGMEGLTVTASSETITITDTLGRAISSLAFKTLAGEGATGVPVPTYSNGNVAANHNITTSTTVISGTTASVPSGGIFSVNLAGASINDIPSSNAAMGYVDTALSSLITERSKIGATINRLTYAVDNLTNVLQNTNHSRSRVMDADYAKASTELSRTQIIAQAATAMLAQANQTHQSVLALLK